ncbi:MAG TPA: hypothetical protein VID67_14230 [Rhizomicrobium sp.]|jgi:hypothetical protein
MFSQVDWRRVATGAGVLLLHLLVLLALLNVTGIVNLGEKAPKEIILTLSPPSRPEAAPQITLPETLPIPFVISPERSPRPITAPPEQQNSQPRGDIRDIGRYLANCSGTFYEQLSPAERKNCLLFKNQHNGDKAPLLGEAKPSPFDKVIQDRNAPIVPAFKQCDPASVNASLHNVPCTNFTGGTNLLEMNPGH